MGSIGQNGIREKSQRDGDGLVQVGRDSGCTSEAQLTGFEGVSKEKKGIKDDVPIFSLTDWIVTIAWDQKTEEGAACGSDIRCFLWTILCLLGVRGAIILGY